MALQEKIKSLGKEEFFGQIIVPTEQVVELVKGKKKTSSRKFYPSHMPHFPIGERIPLNMKAFHQ
ncbi:unnamed protein product [marine sediment metagenome]|uniref:Uncharacterized protein n=1 Tax=marine sediment metagenome TaxID=412755 RepID=X1VJG7_9ZZZZ